MAESLMRNGHISVVYSADQFYRNPSLKYDAYIFHRPNARRDQFLKTFEYLKTSGRTVIADYDDLIFGEKNVALQSSAFKNKTLNEADVEIVFKNNLSALRLFDKITVSTQFLADCAAELNPAAQVSVISNALPFSVRKVHADHGTALRKRPKNCIGYFAGTKSHNLDFPVVDEVINRVMLENDNYNLLVVGPVDIPAGVSGLSNVAVTPAVGFWRLPYLMTLCDTVIAPLEESTFNKCKSRVKFLEAALTGCRLIATPIPDMQEVGAAHITFAETKDDWYEALSHPLDPDENLERVERNLRFIENDDTFKRFQKVVGLQ